MADEDVGTGTGSTGAEGAGAAGGDVSGGDFTLSDAVMQNDDLDTIEIPAEPGVPAAEAAAKPGGEPTEVKPAPAAEGKAPAPAKAAPAPAQPSVAPASPAPQAPAGTAPDLSSMGPKELAGELGRNRAAMLGALAEQKFALSKEEKDALEVDAVAAIPHLLARVYYDAVTASLNNIAQHVPRLVESVTSQLNVTNAAENSFYSKFPGINRGDENHQRTVSMAANIFRQQNPQATQEQAIDAVGKMAMVLLGIQAPQAPTAAARNGTPRPFAPASGTARTVASQPANTPKANPFDGLGVEFD